MIIPSIDLQNGQAVQLIGGAELEIEAGDPIPWAERFSKVGEVAVIDLDAALGRGDHREQISGLCREFPCRVGGGIRDYETARYWLNQGARKIIIGTAAHPDLLRRLPRDRVMVALDARHGEVVVKGWTEGTGASISERLRELAPLVGGFLITFVEREGRLGGTDMEQVRELVEIAPDVRLTIAGGVSTAAEIAELDRLGADAQVGMALYRGDLGLAEAFAAPLVSDRPDGLWTTIVVDEHERALGLAYSNLESLRAALERGEGVYWSRKRGLWHKGASSGATQKLCSVSVDCDRDALRFKVRQSGPGFCHLETASCWGELQGLPALETRIMRSLSGSDPKSYTQRLLREEGLLDAKLREECEELIEARTTAEVTAEAADLFYFLSVKLRQHQISMADLDAELSRRATKVSRRGGDAKPGALLTSTAASTSSQSPLEVSSC